MDNPTPGLPDSPVFEDLVKKDIPVKKEKVLFTNPPPAPLIATVEPSLVLPEVPEFSIQSTENVQNSCEFGSLKYYTLCSIGGIVSCGTTHTMVTPLDLIKCRMQVDPQKYKSIGDGFQTTFKQGGFRALYTGWGPTMLGYSLQGSGKFGLYEVFKVNYHDLVGDEFAYNYSSLVYLAAAASAEFFADILLCPLESIKVRVQTMDGYARGVLDGGPKMLREEGAGVFYKSIVPLWLRQIPYTMMKFASFEKTVVLLYDHVVPKPRDQCSKAEQLLVTFAAGYIAGVFCAVVSHPADTIVSKMNKQKGVSAVELAKQLGFAGLWQGLGLRIVMIGTLTALQWFIYDGFKVYMRIPRPPPPEKPPSQR